MEKHAKKHRKSKAYLCPTYGRISFDEPIPEFEIPETPLSSDVAYQLIHDEMNLDGNPVLNLASFVTTWMDPEAEKLLIKSINKNFIDHDEYPQTEKIHQRVVNILAHLFHADYDPHTDEGFIGTATIGSSEAIMLALLAHKWNWRDRRKAEGKPFDKPNIIFGADVHTCWEKFTRYFDVEARIVPMEPDCFYLRAEKVVPLVDENTIAVGVVLGTTFTGQSDEIVEINQLLEEIREQKGWDIPIHVDGATGAFVMPFSQPEMEWDFRLPRVKSINLSNHKFGLVFPGMGSVIFRDTSVVPDGQPGRSKLPFDINYLGGEMSNYSMNFSRGSSMIILQYYNFLRFGRSGYTEIMANILDNASYLAENIEATGKFNVLSKDNRYPVIAFNLNEAYSGCCGYNEEQLSDELRKHGWIVPAYTLPPNAEKTWVLRVVVKENFSRDMADMFVNHLLEAMEKLDKSGPFPISDRKAHHLC